MFNKTEKKQNVKKMLLCGLDFSGKTTFIKKFKNNPDEELCMTTPFLNLEKITLPLTNSQCLVYDMSGQVSRALFQTVGTVP